MQKEIINAIKEEQSHLKKALTEENPELTFFEEFLRKIDFANINTYNIKDTIISHIVFRAETIAKDVCSYDNENYSLNQRKIDKILTSKKFGIPIMLIFLGVILWITIVGANYPSSLLTRFFWMVR